MAAAARREAARRCRGCWWSSSRGPGVVVAVDGIVGPSHADRTWEERKKKLQNCSPRLGTAIVDAFLSRKRDLRRYITRSP